MESSRVEQVPTFIDHLVLATVAEFVEGKLIADLIHDLKAAMLLPGVLALHVGRCIPVLGEHTFVLHIRAIDTASCDVAYKAATEVYAVHIARYKLNVAQDFRNIVIVDFESQPIGSLEADWSALRIGVFQYKPNAAQLKRPGLQDALANLPLDFPKVKQVSWGDNIAKERMYRANYGYADVDHDIGVILAFSSCQDMYDLGDDPKYWELLNVNAVSTVVKYDAVMLCIHKQGLHAPACVQST